MLVVFVVHQGMIKVITAVCGVNVTGKVGCAFTKVSVKLTFKQLLMSADSPHTNLLVYHIHSAQTEGKGGTKKHIHSKSMQLA